MSINDFSIAPPTARAMTREVGKNPPQARRARGGGAATLLPSGEDARFYIGAFLAEFGVALEGAGGEREYPHRH